MERHAITPAVRKALKRIGIWSWILFLLKWAYELLNHLGNLQTLQDIVNNWPAILKYAALIVGSNWFLPMLGIVCLVLWVVLGRREHYLAKNGVATIQASLKPKTAKEPILQQSTKEPQPIIVAIDELKSLLDEGETLVGRFQEDPTKPTLAEVVDWRKRTRDSARQNILSSVVTTADLLLFDKAWDEGKVRTAAETFVAYRCFEHNSADCAVFRYLWGNVERLKQLIAKIDGGPPATQSNAPPPSQTEAWGITYEQESEMLDILRDSPKAAVMIMSVHGDGAGIRYSRRLHQVLRATGMEAGVCVFGEPWRLPTGINLWASDSADSRQIVKLKDAIRATNMECGDARRKPPDAPGSIQYGIALMIKSLQA